jgi:hypothetical protein
MEAISKVLDSISPHSFPDSLGKEITTEELREALNHSK